jgi:glycosyltransferase involved in cell wall biosynthesis
MPSLAFIVPGRLTTLTGGSIYDRRMIEGLRRRGWAVDVHEVSESFPRPSADALDEVARTFASIADGSTVIVDGLAFGAMPEVVRPHAWRLKTVALVHLPLGAEVGLDPAEARAMEASERRALGLAKAVVVTGSATSAAIANAGIAPQKITLVEPGTDPASIASGSDDKTLRLLCVATISPGKGQESLIRALAANRDQDWTLTCVGSLTRYPATVERVRRLLAVEGIADRVSLLGEVEAASLDAHYMQADMFVLNSSQETYGMAVAEAVAHGLPVVGTRTGAIPGLIGGGAGLIVEPGDLEALTDALRRVLADPGLRASLRDGARCARRRLEPWDVAVGRMAEVLERVIADG